MKIFKNPPAPILLLVPLAICFLINGYFSEAQEQYYTYTDLKKITDAQFWFILISEIIILWFLFFGKTMYKEKTLYPLVISFINPGFIIVTYIFFHIYEETYMTAYLYANRQTQEIGERIPYQVIGVKEEGDTYYVNWLCNFEADDMIQKEYKIPKQNLNTLKAYDTLQVVFKKGYFGVKHSPELILSNLK